MKFAEKIEAIKLRKRGLSYAKILSSINVSKSTLSLWLREIELSPRQLERLLVGRDKSRYAAAKKKKQDRINRTSEIISSAKKEVNSLIINPLFLSGLCLYWAEGAKNPEESVKFVNSDETMVVLMMRWFREICNVPEEKFRMQLHIHNLHSRRSINKYWSKLTGIPKKQCYKNYVKNSSLGQRRNILYNGTCSITISNRALFRRILGWKIGLKEYFEISP